MIVKYCSLFAWPETSPAKQKKYLDLLFNLIGNKKLAGKFAWLTLYDVNPIFWYDCTLKFCIIIIFCSLSKTCTFLIQLKSKHIMGMVEKHIHRCRSKKEVSIYLRLCIEKISCHFDWQNSNKSCIYIVIGQIT